MNKAIRSSNKKSNYFKRNLSYKLITFDSTVRIAIPNCTILGVFPPFIRCLFTDRVLFTPSKGFGYSFTFSWLYTGVVFVWIPRSAWSPIYPFVCLSLSTYPVALNLNSFVSTRVHIFRYLEVAACFVA